MAAIATRIQKKLRRLAVDLIYRRSTLYNLRAAGAVAAAASAISLDGLPSGFVGILAGDHFMGGSYKFAVDTPESGGVVSDAPFTPQLAQPIADGAFVAVVRDSDTDCRGWIELLDETQLAPGIKEIEARVTVLFESLPFEPRIGDLIVAEGHARRIAAIARDAAGAAWILPVKG